MNIDSIVSSLRDAGSAAISFVGSTRRAIGLVVVGLVVLGGVGVATGVFGAPSVIGIENRFGTVNDTTTIIETDLQINNPNPIGVTLGGTSIDYAVEMNDIEMVTGTKKGLSVGKGNSSIHFESALNNTRIPDWWVSHLQNGESSTMSVNATVNTGVLGRSFSAPPSERDIDTDIASAFDMDQTQPVAAGIPGVSDPIVYVNETRGDWGTVTDEETPILMDFDVYNPKPYPITVTEIGYDIDMNDVDMGEGASENPVTILPGETETVEASTVIDNEHLDDWWVSHLNKSQVTDLNITFSARLDLSAAGAGTVDVPLADISHTFETDMLGSKSDTDDGANTTSPTGTDGDSTATPDSDGSTPDSDGSTPDSGGSTATPDSGGSTPTATETDAGGLL